jgi:hypothetical protein
MIKYIAKANDNVISHCKCRAPLASPPGQLDCPWCGCGWMICCTDCGKAFVYGKVVNADDTYDTLIRMNYVRRGYTNVTDEELQNDARMMEEMLTPFEVGDIVVYFDGCYFSVGEEPIEFEGLYASHKLDRLPHAIALKRPEYLREVLGDVNYWLSRERPERLQD